MINKLKIKVVKKGEIQSLRPVKIKPKTQRATAREMVTNVTDWVAELRERKSVETKAAIERLFAPLPVASQS